MTIHISQKSFFFRNSGTCVFKLCDAFRKSLLRYFLRFFDNPWRYRIGVVRVAEVLE